MRSRRGKTQEENKMPQSRIFQSPVVKWGVPVVVLSALVLLFFCGDPLKMSGPVDTAKNDSEPAVAARGPAVDEVVADPHPLATNYPASDAPTGTGGMDALNGIGGWTRRTERRKNSRAL